MKEQDEDIRINFGKYDIPDDLRRFIALDRKHETRFDMIIGFITEIGGLRYYCTPCDVIVFGSNGCDGIHYGFLTDFGTVDTLDEAPIVCISPMDFGHTNKLIARNFRDFLSILLEDSALFFNHFASEAAYLDQVAQWKREEETNPYRDTPEEKQYTEDVKTMISAVFELQHIEHPYEYIRAFQEERKNQAVVTTRDSIHVVLPDSFGNALDEERRQLEQIDCEDEAAVQIFLEGASIPATLAMARNIGMNADNPSWFIMERFLVQHGFNDEAIRAMKQPSY
ncbi:hypothetical protein [Paenibacillus sp. Marseille-Q4541]|uniref:hypothetical protein n=1 Tax=Paenibacillus sp. Marseille-Q4541 TaxID=2831522 RepID=UPI001BA8914A|nr:hypothetical protein [Paenibacillus sp. Marseille-Q4541]